MMSINEYVSLQSNIEYELGKEDLKDGLVEYLIINKNKKNGKNNKWNKIAIITIKVYNKRLGGVVNK